jgi:hypothetical protein
MVKELFAETKIDWTNVPTLLDLEKANSKYIGTELILTRTTEGKLSLKSKSKKKPQPFKYKPSEYLLHKTKDCEQVKQMYVDCGFETKVILQDPFGHPWPSAVCPIGFPFTFPKIYPELRRYSRWICRVHVEIAINDDKMIVSVPHIEPDPCFHPASHIIDTYVKGNVVRGAVAVELLARLITPV